MIEVSDYNKNLEKDLQVDEPVQMILRAGYIESYGENSGVRRDLKDYIRVEEDWNIKFIDKKQAAINGLPVCLFISAVH